MFDFVRRHNRVLQFVLVLLIFPSFVVFGIQGYQRFTDGQSSVAKVAGQDISAAELDAAHRNQSERLRQQMPGLDAKLLDTPQARQRTLEQLVRERVLFQAASDHHLAPTDEQLARYYQSEPNYAWLLKADKAQRADLLAARGLTESMLDAQVRQELALRQVTQGIDATVLAPQQASTAALDAYFQQREIQWQLFDPKVHLGKVQVSDAELQAYYDDKANAAAFMSVEQATIEYVTLDLAAIAKGVTVPEDDLRKYYEENATRYTQPEERRARHIMFKLPAGADAQTKAKVKAKAEAALAEAQKAPARFAELARQQSEDVESAARGGDLDWAARGAMVSKAFEDTVFALKKGGVAATVVESDFGFHVIELADVRGGERRSYDSVRAEMEAEVRKQLAQRRYAEAAEQFTNLVEQEDSLQPVAGKLKLELQRAAALGRGGVGEPNGLLRNPKLLEAVFQSQNLSGKRNTDVIETAANQLVAAHVVQYAPARRLPLADAREQVRAAVVARKAAQAARDEGAARLKEWQAKPEAASLPGAVLVARNKPNVVAPQVLDAVLRASPAGLPRWLGVDLGAQGYAVVKLNKVLPADVAALGDAAQVRAQYAQLWGRAESDAYYAALSRQYKVEYSAKAAAAADTAASGASR